MLKNPGSNQCDVAFEVAIAHPSAYVDNFMSHSGILRRYLRQASTAKQMAGYGQHELNAQQFEVKPFQRSHLFAVVVTGLQ